MLVSVQVLRAVAALLVLFAHAFHPFVAGAGGVDLFFVISGFVIVYSSERFYGQLGGPAQFFAHRLARIVPLYWATTAMFFVLPIPGAGDATWRTIVSSLLFYPYPRSDGSLVPINGVGWTLSFEMFFYAIFALAVILPRHLAVTAASACLIALMWASKQNYLPMPLAYLCTPFLWEFVYGMLIALAYRSGFKLYQSTSISLVFAGVAFYLWTCTLEITGEVAGWRHIIWGGSAAVVLAGVVLSTIPARTGLWAALLLVGDASYALYLTHSITFQLVAPRISNRLALSAIAIGVAIAIYVYLERPTTRYLRGKIRRHHISTSAVNAEKLLPKN